MIFLLVFLFRPALYKRFVSIIPHDLYVKLKLGSEALRVILQLWEKIRLDLAKGRRIFFPVVGVFSIATMD